MTKELKLRSFDIPSIHKFAVGFDSIFDEWLRTSADAATNYPPYNIIKDGDNAITIEMAVAGFKEGDIEIQVEKNNLTTLSITGKQSDVREGVDFLHRGISARNFARTFSLADHIEVIEANITNGILSICLERKIPEEKQPMKIAINYNK